MLLLTNQFHDLFEGFSVIWHKTIILCPTRGQHLFRCYRNLLIRRRLPPNSTVHRTCLAHARDQKLSLAKMEPKNPRAPSIQKKFRFEISEIYEPNGSVHSGCIDSTQATARLVIVLVTRIQGSSTGNNNFVKWKGTLPTKMTRPVKEDRLQSWSRMFRSDQIKTVRSIWCTNRKFLNFGLNGKRLKEILLYSDLKKKKNGSCVDVRFLNLK